MRLNVINNVVGVSEKGKVKPRSSGTRNSSRAYQLPAAADENVWTAAVEASYSSWSTGSQVALISEGSNLSTVVYTALPQTEERIQIATNRVHSGFDRPGRLSPSSGCLSVTVAMFGGDFSLFNSTENVSSSAKSLNDSTGDGIVDVDRSALRTLGIVIGVTDIFVGSIGNFLTICAILSNKKLQTTFHIFIANLCVIDFLTASAMMPFNVTAYWTKVCAFL